MKCYPTVSGNPDFPTVEREILEYWDSNEIFKKSVSTRPESNRFTFYDGPPFANGLPHYGHLLTGFIKDTVARYKTMRGLRVERRFGWDCHGLPVEMLAEKELGVSGRTNIEKFGIDKFNEYCRNSVLRFSQQWQDYVRRQGRWVDFENGYKTMEKSFMESVIWAFNELWNKGLVYESLRVVPYSWACQTPLSNFETRLDNSYKEKVSKSVTVKFEVIGKPSFVPSDVESCKILAWTTTPWTLVANLALAVNDNIKYVGAVVGKELLIFSENYLEHFKSYCTKTGVSCCTTFPIPSSALVSLQYKPLFPYLADCKNSFKILNAGFVTDDTGTGVVHMAPGFGEDDFVVCKSNNIPDIYDDVCKLLSVICPIDDFGRYTSVVSDFVGIHVLDVHDEIIKYLKNSGAWFETSQYTHSYPYCWRTDTPLLYRAMSSWYVEVTKVQQRMIELNEQVNWIPEHIKHGQFGKWLAGIRDWSISRNRFWGTPIPVWKSDNPDYPRVDVYGSIEALERDFGPVEDLHRPYIDNLVRKNPNDPSGKSMMRRVPDVLDCWFESGSMPYAQLHYPFENKTKFEDGFPADFITEYVSQTRGWFYTLFALSACIFDQYPFKNCICHGVVLDIKGQKLSKRLNNYPDPMEMFEKYGSDSVRFTMLSNSVSHGRDLLLDKEGNVVRETLKNVIKPLWNSCSFFTIYANADKVKGSILNSITDVTNIMDQYILYECTMLVKGVLDAMESPGTTDDAYDLKSSCAQIVQFTEKLNNWYIRRSRERFWSEEKSKDKLDAYNTLYTVLHCLIRVVAPFMPFTAEAMWQALDFGCEESVHLADFPHRCVDGIASKHEEDTRRMRLVANVCSSILFLRSANNLRVRQPLSEAVIYPYKCDMLLNLSDEYKNIIMSETNIKALTISDTIGSVASFDIKLNFPALGKRIPSHMKRITALVKAGQWCFRDDGDLLVGEESSEHYLIGKEEFSLNLEANDKYSCMLTSEGTPIGIARIDHNLTKDLILEGIAKDLVRVIQQTRKELKLDMLDRIEITISTKSPEISEALQTWKAFIMQHTLSEKITQAPENADLTSRGRVLEVAEADIVLLLCKIT